MQQTEKYKLNLIESSDPFLPDGLNQNTQKMEDVMLAYEAKVDARIAPVAAMQKDLGTHGKNARIAWGSYTGNDKFGANNPTSLTFDFTPVLLFITTTTGGARAVFIRGCGLVTHGTSNYYVTASWPGKKVSWYNTSRADAQLNNSNFTYVYVAVGYDE